MFKILSKIKSGKAIELSTAFVSIVTFIIFSSYMAISVRKNSIKHDGLQTFTARFNDVDGILIGSDVKLAGYKIGSVTEIKIIPESYDVKITIEVTKSLTFPKDTTAAVKTSGLFGGKYISIIPGAEDETLKPGQEIIYTQSAINLENLIGTFANKS